MNYVEKSRDIFKGPVALFLTVAFIPAWILFLIPLFLRMVGIEETATIALVAWSAAMWMPGLGAIIATRAGERKELKTLGLGKLGNTKIYLWAWLGPILAVLLTGVISWLFGWGKFDPSFQLIRQATEGLPEVQETAIPLLLAAQIAASLTLAPLFNMLFAPGGTGWNPVLEKGNSSRVRGKCFT